MVFQTGCLWDACGFLFVYIAITSWIFVSHDLQVANFGSAEDDGTFWSRMIKPEAVTHAEVCI